MPVKHAVEALQGSIWGCGPILPPNQRHSVEDVIGLTMDDLGKLPIASCLSYFDRTIYPLEIASTSTGSAVESKASLNIPATHQMLGVKEDFDWIDDLLSVFLKSLDPKPCEENGGWETLKAFLQPKCRNYTPRPEIGEGVVDRYSEDFILLADSIHEFLDADAPRISSRGQQPVQLYDTLVYPDIVYLLASYCFARGENKTLPVMLAHASALQNATGKSKKYMDNVSLSAMAILAQAYASSAEPAYNTRVVVMGHPALYRIAYVQSNYLCVSSWRSSNHTDIAERLDEACNGKWTAPIIQGRFVAETLALASFTREQLDKFLSDRSPALYPTSYRQIMVRFIRVGSTALQRQLWSRIYLQDMEVSGTLKSFPHRCCKDLAESRFSCCMKPFKFLAKFYPSHNCQCSTGSRFPRCIKPFKVWANESTIAKVVEEEELRVLQDVSGIPGIPELQGFMHVKSSMNEGRLVALIANAGEPVEIGLWKLPAVMDPLKDILRSLHVKGWHHHDIHRRNVVQDEGSICLVDFGKAQRSEECQYGTECPELAFVSPPPKSQDDSEYSELPSVPPPAYHHDAEHPERSLANFSPSIVASDCPSLASIDEPITPPPLSIPPPFFSLDKV